MSKTRAVILPFPGDPFLLRYWLNLAEQYWLDEIDTLYVCMNSPIEKNMVIYCRELCRENDLRQQKIHFNYEDRQMEHGDVITNILPIVNQDNVMLVEDDCFIFSKNVVNNLFSVLEQTEKKVVGSKRGSCSPQISEAAKKKWGLSYEGYGDQGCNFWPNLFLCSRKLLLSTDQNFAARAWKKGEIIEPLGYTVEDEIVVGDTFVNTSLQIRSKVDEKDIYYIPQYHAHPDDVMHYETRAPYTPFDGVAKWVHIGSLSSGVGGVLKDEFGRCLARRSIDPKGESPSYTPPSTEMEKKEWERRIQWWLRFIMMALSDKNLPIECYEFAISYLQAVERLMRGYNIHPKNIDARIGIYQKAFEI